MDRPGGGLRIQVCVRWFVSKAGPCTVVHPSWAWDTGLGVRCLRPWDCGP